MKTMSYDLDMGPGGVPLVVPVSQYDDDFQIAFTLLSRNGRFVVDSGSTAEVRGTKADGHGYSASASISGRIVTVTGAKQMTAAAGPQPFEIVVKNSSGKQVASANYTLLVERAALDYDTPQSESKLREIGDISGALKDMQTMKEYSDSSTAAAKSAKESAESASKSAESASSSASSANAAAAAADKSAKDAASSVGSTSHLQTARALQVDLSSERPANFDGSADQTGIGVSGTLPLAHGGTGFTNAMAAANAFGNALSSYSATPVDADYYVSQHSNNGLYTTYRRPFTGLWTYVMNKISSVLGLTKDNYGGTAAKAESVAWEDVTGKPENIGSGDSKNLAQIETAGSATNAHTAGEYVIIDNALYRVKADVAKGGAWTVGENIESTTVGNELNTLNNNIPKTIALLNVTFTNGGCTISNAAIHASSYIIAVKGNGVGTYLHLQIAKQQEGQITVYAIQIQLSPSASISWYNGDASIYLYIF